MTTALGSIPKMKNQVYQRGYALDWYPVEVVPGPGETVPQTGWKMRLTQPRTQDLVLEPTITQIPTENGLGVRLTYTFDATLTQTMGRRRDARLVLFYKENDEEYPRAYQELIMDRTLPKGVM